MLVNDEGLAVFTDFGPSSAIWNREDSLQIARRYAPEVLNSDRKVLEDESLDTQVSRVWSLH